MTVKRGGYQGATACTSGPEPGTKNLMSAYLARHSGHGGKNLGIFNCRPIRGTNKTTSIHGEGRAGDHGCPVGNTWMQAWADLLVAHSAELGIQCVIYNRRIWSCTYPDGWRPYSGVVPHTDHAHVEQTRESARTLTLARINQVLGGGGAVPTPSPAPSVGRPVIKLGSNNAHVGVWQKYLRDTYPAYRNSVTVKKGVLLGVDNDFGAQTVAWTKEYQERKGLTIDGVVGPQTWRTAGLG